MELPNELYCELLEHLTLKKVIRLTISTGKDLPHRWIINHQDELSIGFPCGRCKKTLLGDPIFCCRCNNRMCYTCIYSCQGCNNYLCWNCIEECRYCREYLGGFCCKECVNQYICSCGTHDQLCSAHGEYWRNRHALCR